jgi:protein-tyrosine phosphatase
MTRVLFVCIGNICRSVFAEYIARTVFGDEASFESAGIRPQRSRDPYTTHSLMETFSVDASNHVPRDVRKLDLDLYDLVIALDWAAANQLEDMGVPDSKLLFWKTRDPWGGDLPEYDRAGMGLKHKLDGLKAAGLDTTGASHRDKPA